MLLRKYMSLIGIGSAKVDLILEKEHVRLGECIKGHFLINGGLIEQHIKRIECDLIKMNAEDEKEEVVDSTTILSESSIESEDYKKLPFSFFIPSELSPSGNGITYRFKTRLIFQEGVKSIDQDIIFLLP